ncbi:MAG TPA: pyruvate synthase subunit beta [Sedimenticola thiotaurini]|uniref:Pyruvate synthase subunit beta n=1 Tax=Sedimenticola thiotaurini TaxID=1543721 RepID=A0A831W3D9_9GAMM|nr:pyruvate synthase subunit beta [Sedimenticola thiotaurini]
MSTTAAKKTTAVSLDAEEYAHPGNRACTGCTLNTLYRVGLKALGRDCIFAVPPSCLTVVQGLYPISSSQMPILNVTFASTAAAASGIRAAMKRRGKKTQVVAWAGDGGTADIGLQALSAAIERGEDLIYICYDNEAYMNTGVQRSGTTPKGTLTNNTLSGKAEAKKDVPAIVAAHRPAYVATCSAAFPLDFHDKLLKAKGITGFKYIHIHTPCPPGWGVEDRLAIAVGKAAVESGLYDLYEIENGRFRLSGPSQKLLRKKKLPPVSDYFAMQGRFKALDDAYLQAVQQEVDDKWAGYRERFL